MVDACSAAECEQFAPLYPAAAMAASGRGCPHRRAGISPGAGGMLVFMVRTGVPRAITWSCTRACNLNFCAQSSARPTRHATRLVITNQLGSTCLVGCRASAFGDRAISTGYLQRPRDNLSSTLAAGSTAPASGILTPRHRGAAVTPIAAGRVKQRERACPVQLHLPFSLGRIRMCFSLVRRETPRRSLDGRLSGRALALVLSVGPANDRLGIAS